MGSSIQEFDQSAIALAKQNLCEGVFYEPRVYYDSLVMPATANVIVNGNPDVFRNGEQFPVRITHILAAYRPDTNGPATPDETAIQRANLRIIQHDNYYMNRDLMPLPHWSNVVVALPQVTTQGSCNWEFKDKPFILSVRDSLQIKVVLEFAPSSGSRTVGAAVHGYGLVSKQPYFLSSTVALSDTTQTQLSTDDFRNDGAEPIVVTGINFTCGAASGVASAAGDIRQLRASVKQIGNGTNATWNIGPIGAVSLPLAPVTMYGVTTGRTLVHKIPGDGWIWEPGEGVSIEASESVVSGSGTTRLAIGMAGHIVVT